MPVLWIGIIYKTSVKSPIKMWIKCELLYNVNRKDTSRRSLIGVTKST